MQLVHCNTEGESRRRKHLRRQATEPVYKNRRLRDQRGQRFRLYLCLCALPVGHFKYSSVPDDGGSLRNVGVLFGTDAGDRNVFTLVVRVLARDLNVTHSACQRECLPVAPRRAS